MIRELLEKRWVRYVIYGITILILIKVIPIVFYFVAAWIARLQVHY